MTRLVDANHSSFFLVYSLFRSYRLWKCRSWNNLWWWRRLMGKVAADNSHKWVYREPLQHGNNGLSSPWHGSIDPVRCKHIYSLCSRFNIICYLELQRSTGLRILNGVDFLRFFTAGIIIIIIISAVLFSSTPILLILVSSTAHVNSSDTKITGLFTMYSIREHGKLSLKLVFRFFLLLYNSYFQIVPP